MLESSRRSELFIISKLTFFYKGLVLMKSWQIDNLIGYWRRRDLRSDFFQDNLEFPEEFIISHSFITQIETSYFIL